MNPSYQPNYYVPQYPATNWNNYPGYPSQPAQYAQQLSHQYAGQPMNPFPVPNAIPIKQSTLYGAYGDGIHDDTSAVQLALQKSPAASEFILPPGTYRITAPLVIDKPISIRGDCTLACSFPNALWGGAARCDNPDTWKQHMLVIRANGVSISGVRFANNTNIEGIAAILVEGGDFTLCNCIVSDFNQGLMLGKLKSPNITPVTYHNINIKNNQFLNIKGVLGGSICYGDGIAFFGCENVIIDGNSLSAAQGRTPRNGINSGPEGFTQSTYVTISNNRVLGDWDYPITTEGGRRCLIEKNTVEGCCIAGIIERGQEITVRSNVIRVIGGRQHGCTCGIEFYGVDNGFIEKNVVTGSAKHGIMCVPSHETKGSNNIGVHDNSVEGEFLHGIYVGNSSVTHVVHNRIILTHPDKGSIGVVGWYTSGLQCCNNDIQATNGTGCIFTGSTDVTMSGNILANSRAGLYVARECKDIKIFENDFSACKETKHDAHPEVQALQMNANKV